MPGEWIRKFLLKVSKLSCLLILFSSFFVLSSPGVYGQFHTPLFKHLSVEDGLPDNMVSWFLQDHLGFLWIGTHNGLVRYDGYDFVTYEHNPNDTSSINNNFITYIYEDKEGVLWIGTPYGLEKFSRINETFIHNTPDTSGSENNLGNQVQFVHEDRYGKLWVGSGNGLYKFDRATGKFTVLQYDSTDPGSISHNVVQEIYEDKGGTLWFASGGGLDKLNFETGRFEHYWNDAANREKTWETNTSKYWINSVCGDSKGSIWLGTHMGIVEFKPATGNFNQYIPASGIKQAGKNNIILPICTDPSGILWAGTSNGLYAFDIKSKKFIDYYSHDITEPGSLSDNYISSIYFDQSGILWVGTFGGGANKLKLKKNSIKNYVLDRKIMSFIEDKGMLLINTDNGWIKFDPSAEKINLNPFDKNKVVWKVNSHFR